MTKQVYQQELELDKLQRESHPLCKDTPTKTAWVAYREGEVRCFLEDDSYPHKAKGYNVE